MLIPASGPTDELISQWWRASFKPEVNAAFDALHVLASDAAIAHRPICIASGKCCNFKEHGHYLLVTGLEVAWTLRQQSDKDLPRKATNARADGKCVFLDGPNCSIHPLRPSGCRAYFCDKGDGQWQTLLGERFHATIRRLHDELSVEYLCAEWMWMVEMVTDAQRRGVCSSDRAD